MCFAFDDVFSSRRQCYQQDLVPRQKIKQGQDISNSSL